MHVHAVWLAARPSVRGGRVWLASSPGSPSLFLTFFRAREFYTRKIEGEGEPGDEARVWSRRVHGVVLATGSCRVQSDRRFFPRDQ